MATDAEKRFADLTKVARRCANYALAVSGGRILFEDAIQEALSWLYAKPRYVEAATDEAGDIYVVGLARTANEKHMRGWARRELAHALGQDLRWQVNYRKEQVEAALPYIWSDERPQIGNETGIRAATDHATAGNVQALTVDVKRALEECAGTKDSAVLFARYCLGLTWDEAGLLNNSTGSAARARSERCIEDMVDFLNGLHPVRDDGPGTRSAISNDAARAITDRGGEPSDATSLVMS